MPYWVAVSQIAFIGPRRIRRLLDRFGSLAAAWSANEGAIRRTLDDRAAVSFLMARAKIDPLLIFERISGDGIDVLTLEHDGYPPLLREIASPPPVLYLRGQVLETDRAAVAVVGTRRTTAYGREMAMRIGDGLARAGITVVSGLALGVDGVAHSAALGAGGRTLAVLGSGVNVIYPYEHGLLAERVSLQGAVMSEYPPDRKPDAPNFPARNRLIAGLSLGVAVIEAPERSGALITADFAADQGREVFVVPGPATSPASAGTNRLLRDGARIVRSADDILEDLDISQEASDGPVQQVLPLDDLDRRLLSVLTADAQHIDDIAERAGLPLPQVSAMLLTLELQNLVRNIGAQHYTRH